jgi:hypothetical protein
MRQLTPRVDRAFKHGLLGALGCGCGILLMRVIGFDVKVTGWLAVGVVLVYGMIIGSITWWYSK